MKRTFLSCTNVCAGLLKPVYSSSQNLYEKVKHTEDVSLFVIMKTLGGNFLFDGDTMIGTIVDNWMVIFQQVSRIPLYIWFFYVKTIK